MTKEVIVASKTKIKCADPLQTFPQASVFRPRLKAVLPKLSDAVPDPERVASAMHPSMHKPDDKKMAEFQDAQILDEPLEKLVEEFALFAVKAEEAKGEEDLDMEKRKRHGLTPRKKEATQLTLPQTNFLRRTTRSAAAAAAAALESVKPEKETKAATAEEGKEEKDEPAVEITVDPDTILMLARLEMAVTHLAPALSYRVVRLLTDSEMANVTGLIPGYNLKLAKTRKQFETLISSAANATLYELVTVLGKIVADKTERRKAVRRFLLEHKPKELEYLHIRPVVKEPHLPITNRLPHSCELMQFLCRTMIHGYIYACVRVRGLHCVFDTFYYEGHIREHIDKIRGPPIEFDSLTGLPIVKSYLTMDWHAIQASFS